MAKKDDRLFIRLHIGMPEHPKIEGLSDKAFRLLIETWCWAGRNPQTNGHIAKASWTKRGTPKARLELIAAGLFDDDLDRGAIVHDWDDWQRTWAVIQEAKAEKRDAGAFGAHKRWHLNKGIREAECEFC
jgi:hypothetical protein